MDHRFSLIAALLAFSSSACWSGYAYPADPPGFQRGGPWGAGFGYAPAANDQTFGRVVHTPNGPTAPVPGKPTTLPASYRFASNAPKFASRIIFMHPGVRTAAGVLAWLGMAGIVWDAVNGVWRKVEGGESDDGLLWRVNATAAQEQWHSTKQQACEAVKTYWSSNDPSNEYISASVSDNSCILKWRQRPNGPQQDYMAGYLISKENTGTQCPAGWTPTPAGCLSPALTQPQFEDALNPHPMPEKVPLELPYPSPLPIEPKPWINPEPGPNPQTRPRFVPNGDPVKNPNYDPNAQPSPENQPYIQPGTRINPSPTEKDPFRLDIQPVDKPTPTPDPQHEQDEGPGQDSNAKPQENPGLCDQYPDIVACAKLGEAPEAKPLENIDKTLEIKKEQGWGPENGTCPAPKTATVAGVALEMSFQPLCDFATGIRPVIIGLAWISAVMGFLGLSRKD